MEQYLKLVETVLEKGVTKTDRTGVGTRGIFGYETRFDLREGFPLVTVKKTNFDAIAHELLWFISGNTNIRYLVQNGVNIWNEWPYKRYCASITSVVDASHPERSIPMSLDEFAAAIRDDEAFANKWGDLGPVYGWQWRKWGATKSKSFLDQMMHPGIDQLAEVIKTIRTNPDSRRMIVTAWNPAELHLMALPACHAFFQFNCEPLSVFDRQRIYFLKLGETPDNVATGEQYMTFFDGAGIPRNYLSLKLTQRSADIMLGVPFNIASYALLLAMIAKVTNTVAKDLIYSLGDAHIYTNHIKAAEGLAHKDFFNLPKLELGDKKELDDFTFDDIKLLNYHHGPYVKLPVAV